MDRASIGGRANWAGAAFELRLGVQYGIYILMGEDLYIRMMRLAFFRRVREWLEGDGET